MFKAVVFDLDNTLYDARQYFLGSFGNISDYLSKKYRLRREIFFGELVTLLDEKTSMYPYLFDDLLAAFQIDTKEVKEVVKIFNEYDGQLKPFPDTIPTLQALKEKRYKLGIITDGNVERQKRKVEKLGITQYFGVILYAKKSSPKPSSMPYFKALEALRIRGSSSYYVADNPLIDFIGAKKAGMKTVRILRGEFAGIPRDEYVDFEITSLSNLFDVIG